MSEGFLSRWSRRKRDAPADETASSVPPVVPEPAEPEAATGDRAAEAEITPEELALLPSLDDLTAETDIGAFLRRGVPRALRDAALRRAWALDPKIRDFVCEAREYAYDWNVPGGVPGNGDLLPTDDVAEMVRQIFGEAPSTEAVAGGVSPSMSADAHTAEPNLRDALSQRREATTTGPAGEAPATAPCEESAPQQEAVDVPVASGPATALLPGKTGDAARPSPCSDFAAAQASWVESAGPAPSVARRHGRATPI